VTERRGPGIDDKVRFLSDPASYPECPRRVETIETHFSWVFLTDRYAYKLKKPARGQGFDFRTVEARRRNALAELRLNRRLAPDIYLRIVRLTTEAGNKLVLGGRGIPLDWLVKMVRLEPERMFDHRIAHGTWKYAELESLAQRLARFFATARPVRLTPHQWLMRATAELRRSMAVLSRSGGPRLGAMAAPIVRRIVAAMTRHRVVFKARASQSRFVDGHGDLRPEHIYLRDTPRIIDCLEFCADLRRLDPVAELAFLALECRRQDGPPILARLLRRYRERSGDTPPETLVHFYTALNALVRARIAVEHLAEPGGHTPQEWLSRAAGYLAIAADESGHLDR
jgi:aminoglycoside phosphotransferase family enzyme